MTTFSTPPRLLMLALAAALAGCQATLPEIDASSRQDLDQSLEQAMQATANRPSVQARLEAAIAIFGEAYGETVDPYLPDWSVVDGMSVEGFIHFAEQIQRNAIQFQPLPQTWQVFPDPALTGAILQQLELEVELLEAARLNIQNAGKNTIDQYPIIDVGFIPPNPEMPLELDLARFLVKIKNDSGFDAYRPEFQIRILSPQDEFPVLMSRTFSFQEVREPIAPGEIKLFEMRCCGVADDPWHNAQLKSLPDDAQIEVTLTKVMDHGTREALETHGFSLRDHQRLGLIRSCIAAIRGNEATWVPSLEDDTLVCAGGPSAIPLEARS